MERGEFTDRGAGKGRPMATLSLELDPADVTAPSLARNTLKDAELVPAQHLPNAVLLVSEIVTNAIRHGPVPCGVIVMRVQRLPELVRIEIEDQGHGFRQPDLSTARGIGGIGLKLIESLAERWGIESYPRTTVWFELRTD